MFDVVTATPVVVVVAAGCGHAPPPRQKLVGATLRLMRPMAVTWVLQAMLSSLQGL
jgi:hypothetical protein